MAILLVLVGHNELLGLEKAGRVGVTLFFVLSGYLITSLLVAESERTGRINLRAFYLRRVRRLAPALIAVVAATGLLAWAVGDTRYSGQAAAALLYVGNLVPDMGYLSHTWSLALEEQFYAVWPVLFVLLPRRWLAPLALVVAATAIVLRLTTDLPGFHPLMRLDPIAVGCLLALAPLRLPSRAGWLGWGLATLVVTIDPDVFTIGLTAGTLASLVIVSTARPGLLSWRPLVRVGELSYGLYLWHFAPSLLLPPYLAIPLSFVLALVSERWIERPWRLRLHDAVGDPLDHVQVAGRARLDPVVGDLGIGG